MADKLTILDLPVDILALILLPLLSSPAPIALCPCKKAPVNPLRVFLIHPALYNIAAPLFYRRNTFDLNAGGSHGQLIRSVLEWAPGEPIALSREPLLRTIDARRRIAKLDIKIDRLRGWLNDFVVPMVQDMVMNGDLEYLNVSVHSPAPMRSTSLSNRRAENEMDMFTRPPLAGFLRVLADPHLRTARLWVSPRHVPAWCRFHTGQPCALANNGADGAEHDQLLEIDWREILRVVDPEQRDVAVAWAEDPDVVRHR